MSVVVTMHLWTWWGDIAIDAESDAKTARQRIPRRPESGAWNPAPAMYDEGKASLVAVAAAAHAIDALYGSVRPLLATAPAPRRRWARILETLKIGFRVGGARGGGKWATELEWLFDLRDGVVHSKPKPRPTIPHPIGVHTGEENVAYAVESASRAVDLLLDVLYVCSSSPREATVHWANSYRSAVDQLLERRGAVGT